MMPRPILAPLALALAVAVALGGCAPRKSAPGGEPDPDTLSVGIYQTDTLTSTESPGLVVTLALEPTHVAELTSDHLDGSAAVRDRGAWEPLPEGGIRVTVASRDGLTPPDTVDFIRSGRVLRHAGHRFGPEPIEFRRANGAPAASPETPR